MRTDASNVLPQNKILVRLALATGLILLVPLVATRLSDEVTWTAADFVVMGALLFGGGLVFVFAARRMHRHRALIGLTVLGAVLWVWAELAVGVFTNWGS